MPFRVPTRLWLAPGAFQRLPDVVTALGARRALLVYDEGLSATPWATAARHSLEAAGLAVTIFDGVEVNPMHTTVDALADQARVEAVDVVIGLGGGSVLDAAKAVAMLVRNAGSCVDYEGRNRYAHAPVPFIAVPTTCGTGSEVTWVSVITQAQAKRKMSIKGETMFPTAALVDPNLLSTLPHHLVASTGMDALTHALEAYTGTARNPVSDALAEKAVLLLMKFLRRAANDIVGDAEARAAVMEASTLAGLAFGNADVGGVHCLSETLGGLWDVPHGLTNAMLLLPVMRYHLAARAVHEPLANLYQLIVPSTLRSTHVEGDAERFLDRLAILLDDLDIPPFAHLSIPRDAYPHIAEMAVANNSNGSNPQPMAVSDYLAILEGV